MKPIHLRAQLVADALAACDSLAVESPAREHLWLTVLDCICTKGTAYTNPLGSRSLVMVTEDYSSIELIAVMEWIIANEAAARAMESQALFIRLRGQATRGCNGSGRAAQADQLRGLTNVSPGNPVRFAPESLDVAS